MKKTFSILLILAMILSVFAGCGSTPDSRINIVGAYYGNCGAENGMQDLFVVFDYTNDETNRQMPEDTSAVTAFLVEANKYEAVENEKHTYYHDGASYTTADYSWFERQTGYRYVLGYGDLLGGAKPARMFVHFVINPNDVSSSEKLTLTVEDQVAEFAVSEMKEISVIDEILQANGNFEQDYIVASGKWRLDTIYRHIHFITKIRALPGDALSHFKIAQENLYAEDLDVNISMMEEPTYGFNTDNDDYWLGTPVKGLPSFNMDVFLAAYPNEAGEIHKLFNEYEELNRLLGQEGASIDRIEELINSIDQTYIRICEAWGIECVSK